MVYTRRCIRSKPLRRVRGWRWNPTPEHEANEHERRSMEHHATIRHTLAKDMASGIPSSSSQPSCHRGRSIPEEVQPPERVEARNRHPCLQLLRLLSRSSRLQPRTTTQGAPTYSPPYSKYPDKRTRPLCQPPSWSLRTVLAPSSANTRKPSHIDITPPYLHVRAGKTMRSRTRRRVEGHPRPGGSGTWDLVGSEKQSPAHVDDEAKPKNCLHTYAIKHLSLSLTSGLDDHSSEDV
jgi:hypothetical protein